AAPRVPAATAAGWSGWPGLRRLRSWRPPLATRLRTGAVAPLLSCVHVPSPPVALPSSDRAGQAGLGSPDSTHFPAPAGQAPAGRSPGGPGPVAGQSSGRRGPGSCPRTSQSRSRAHHTSAGGAIFTVAAVARGCVAAGGAAAGGAAAAGCAAAIRGIAGALAVEAVLDAAGGASGRAPLARTREGGGGGGGVVPATSSAPRS